MFFKNQKDKIMLTDDGKRLKEIYPNWSNKVCNAIVNKEVIIGMSKEQVIATEIYPTHVIEQIYKAYTQEQWVMPDDSEYNYLFFHDEILTGIHKKPTHKDYEQSKEVSIPIK